MKKSILKKSVKHLFLIIIGFVMIYPILWLFMGSFKANYEIFSVTSFFPEKVIWENYPKGWVSVPEFGCERFFFNSFKLVFIITGGTIVSTSLAAYAFARLEFRLKKILFLVLIGTLLLPMQILLIPRYLLFSKLGWTNSILPMTVPSFFVQVNGAFFTYLMIQFMRGIPRELDEAAIVDGCGAFRIFWNILIPICKPAIVTIGIFSFIWSWDNFLEQLMYLNEISQYTIALVLRMFLDDTAMISWGSLFAMSFLSLVPCMLVFFFAQKYFVEGIVTSGIKG